MSPTVAAFALLLLAAMVVGSRGSPPTTLPHSSEMLGSVVAGIAVAAEQSDAQSVGASAAAALLLGAVGVATARARRKPQITEVQKRACADAFAVLAATLHSSDGLPQKLPAELRVRLAREHAPLSDDQIERQYQQLR